MSHRMRPESAESQSWLLMRLSGFLMPTLIIVHLVIQHLVNDVHDLQAEWAAERWSKIGWRIWAGMMMLLSVGHGLNGTRHVIDDYVHDPVANQAARTGALVLGIGLAALGLAGLIAFDKDETLRKLQE